MVVHVSLRPKALEALRAGKRSFILMNPLVDLQVLLFGEPFGARRKRASIRLSTVMNVHVRFQTNTTIKILTAALEWA